MSATENNNIFKRGDSWYHRTKYLDDKGLTKYSKLGGFKSFEEAQESYNNNVIEFEKQKNQYWSFAEKKEMMFKDYLSYWLENIYSSRIESTTKEITSYAIYSLIIPSIDYDLKLRQLTTAYLDEILEKASQKTKSAGETSRGVLYRALKDAVANGYITFNPVKDTKAYPRKKPEITILNKDQIKKFLKYAQKSNWYLEILLGLFSGLRKGEILGLKESDFNIEKQTVHIERQLARKEKSKGDGISNRVEKPPKTENSYRTLKVHKVILDELAKRKDNINFYKEKYGKEYNDNSYLSCQENGDSHALSSLNEALKKICILAGVPVVTVHGLRHLYATILLEQGVPLEKISAMLGHESIHTTYECYCDVMYEKGEILSYLNEIFNEDEEEV